MDGKTKSEYYYDFFCRKIADGTYRTGEKFPSIRQISIKYNISASTSSIVVSRLLADGLLVKKPAQGTFVAGDAAVSLRKKVIGCIFYDFSNQNIVDGMNYDMILKSLPHNYYTVPINTYDRIDLFLKGFNGLLSLGVDGMLVLPPPATEHYAPDLDTYGLNLDNLHDIPIVFINRRPANYAADLFCYDYANMAEQAAIHLRETGRKRLGIVMADSMTIDEAMLRGFEAGVTAKLREQPELPDFTVLPYSFYTDEAENVIAQLKKLDGILVSDSMFYTLKDIIRDGGIDIPGDLGVVAMNDSLYTRFFEPNLTAIPYPYQAIGRESVHRLVELIQAKDQAGGRSGATPDAEPLIPEPHVFRTKLIRRGST